MKSRKFRLKRHQQSEKNIYLLIRKKLNGVWVNNSFSFVTYLHAKRSNCEKVLKSTNNVRFWFACYCW